MQQFLDAFASLWQDSGLARLMNFEGGGWKNLIMIGVACVLLFLAIKKQFEPLLLLPIAFGMLLVNLPLGGIMDPQRNSLEAFSTQQLVQYVDGTYEEVYPVAEEKRSYTVADIEKGGYELTTYKNANGEEMQVLYIGDNMYKVSDVAKDGTVTVITPYWQHFEQGGLLWYLYQGVKFGIYPPLIFLGIGENGHLAFNDPAVADFNDPKMVKIVELDDVCRQQQVNDGCFPNLDAVPKNAMTMTMSLIMSIPQAICVVPTIRKADAVHNAIYGEVTTACPASILRNHPSATLYLDADSASKL